MVPALDMNFIIKLLPLVSALVIYLVRVIELQTKRQTIAGAIRENITLRYFIIIGTGMLLGSMAEYLLLKKTISWPFFASGWAVGLFSFYVRRRAIAALGRFWSLHVEIRDTHELVREGPFRWVRHPAYFSMILEILSISLLLRSWYTTAIVAALFLPTLFTRIRIEENALIEKFGDAYRQYRRQVPAIFPYKGPCA
jgi:protein-S-isoprenylcysteine O-methyltransferase Ste14